MRIREIRMSNVSMMLVLDFTMGWGKVSAGSG